MKIQQVNRWLMIAAAIQIALVGFVWTRGNKNAVTAMQPILNEISVENVSEVVVEANDEKIVLSKKDGSWVVSNHFDFPVKDTEVDDALTELSRIRARDPMTQSVARHEQLGVATEGFTKKLTITSGETSQVIWVGNAAGGRRTSIRLGESADVFAAEGVQVANWSSSVAQWVDTKVFEGSSNEVKEFTITKPSGTSFLFSKNEDSWMVTMDGKELSAPKGKEFDSSFVSGLLSTLINVRLVKPADPSTTVTTEADVNIVFNPPPKGEGEEDSPLESVASPTIHFSVGQAVDGDRIIKREGAPLVWISNSSVQKVIEFEPSKLWQDPPKEAEAGALPPGMPSGLPPGMTMPPGMQMR